MEYAADSSPVAERHEGSTPSIPTDEFYVRNYNDPDNPNCQHYLSEPEPFEVISYSRITVDGVSCERYQGTGGSRRNRVYGRLMFDSLSLDNGAEPFQWEAEPKRRCTLGCLGKCKNTNHTKFELPVRRFF